MSVKNFNETIAHFSLFMIMFSSLMNAQFQFVFGIEVYKVIPFLFLYLFLDSFIYFLFFNKVNFSKVGFMIILVLLFVIFVSLLYALYNNNGRDDYVLSLIMAIILSLLSWRLFTNPIKAAKVSVAFFSLTLFFTLIDIDGLIRSFVTSTRGALNAGPLSISLLCSFLVAGAIFVVKDKYVKTVLVLVAISLAVVTLSRGPILSLLVALIISISLRKKIVLFILPFIIVMFVPVLAFFAQYRMGSILDRLHSYNQVFSSLSQFPFGGFGVGYYNKTYGVYAHNALLQWWLELSFPVSFLLLILVSVFAFLNLSYKRHSKIDSRGYFAVLMLITFVSAQISFDPIRVLIYLIPLIVINVSFWGLKWR